MLHSFDATVFADAVVRRDDDDHTHSATDSSRRTRTVGYDLLCDRKEGLGLNPRRTRIRVEKLVKSVAGCQETRRVCEPALSCP